MKKGLILLLCVPVMYTSFAQNRIQVFDQVLFYDGYAPVVSEPVQQGVVRHRNDLYATRLTDLQLQGIGDTLTALVTIKAACDNYDRIGNVNLAFVPKGNASYGPDTTMRIEIARFITPFMNKNIQPDTVPFRFSINNVASILRNSNLRSRYDVWVELEVFGVPYAANNEVAGCSGRNDVFYGSLVFETGTAAAAVDGEVLLPLAFKQDFNNYNSTATDEVGKTEKTISFTVEEHLTDAVLFLITSNHGANAGGEEYSRRNHYVYVDGASMLEYKPGSQSCEPFRKYNTQGNGIYGRTPKTDAQWQSFSNWCPGDVIPIRKISLGALDAGTHVFRIAVPDARFNGGEGNIPLSLYLHGTTSGKLSIRQGQVAGSRVSIYPNPVSDMLYVDVDHSELSSLEVYNVYGQKVCASTADSVNLAALPTGVYVVRVFLMDGTFFSEQLSKR